MRVRIKKKNRKGCFPPEQTVEINKDSPINFVQVETKNGNRLLEYLKIVLSHSYFMKKGKILKN